MRAALAPTTLAGNENRAADHLSILSSLLQLIPHATEHPTALPEELMAALVTQRPDWTSQNWRTVLHSSKTGTLNFVNCVV